MKIVHVIARLNVGGPARHVVLLAQGLQARGHDVLLVHGAIDAGEASFDVAAGPGVRDERHAHLGRRVSALGDLRAFMALVRTIFREQPDIVHTHTAKAGTLGRLAALVYNATRGEAQRAAVCHTFHGHVLEGYFSPAVARMVLVAERLLARISDRIITISPQQRQDIVERFRVAPAERTVVLPLALALDALLAVAPGAPDLRRWLGASEDDIIVGFLGRMVPIKDVQLLVRACAAARRRQPALRFVLAGDGLDRPALERLVTELGLADRTHFLGWIDDLPRFYATIDLLALSSLNEGTPVAIIESMAAGRAVVATAVGGVPDLIEDGATGILVRSRTVDDMANAIADLAGSPETRDRLGAAGRRHVAARYRAAEQIADMEELYSGMLTERRARLRS